MTTDFIKLRALRVEVPDLFLRLQSAIEAAAWNYHQGRPPRSEARLEESLARISDLQAELLAALVRGGITSLDDTPDDDDRAEALALALMESSSLADWVRQPETVNHEEPN